MDVLGTGRFTRYLCAPAAAMTLVLSLAAGVNAMEGSPDRPHYGLYRADQRASVGGAPPEELQLLRPPGADPWPEPVTQDLKRTVLKEWPADQRYGTIYSEFEVHVPGHNVVIKEQGPDHAKAIHDARDKVERQLRRISDRQNDVRSTLA